LVEALKNFAENRGNLRRHLFICKQKPAITAFSIKARRLRLRFARQEANVKIDPKILGWAGAIAAAVMWTIYSGSVFLLLILAINISGDFGYTDFTNFDLIPPLVKFLLGLCIVMSGAGLTGKMIAEIYNYLIEKSNVKLP